MTRSEITAQAIKELSWRNARVRQVHNIPHRRRKNHIEKGWPDIQGYTKTGTALLCEVKTKNDHFSAEQIERLNDAEKCGCCCMVAYFTDQFILESWLNYKTRQWNKRLNLS